MKHLLCLFLWLGWPLAASAQSYPAEWAAYTQPGYLYAIQSDHNTRGLSESEFRNELLNAARIDLAKKVQVAVKEAAELNKQAIDGRTRQVYTSSTHFSTEVNLKLVESQSCYDPQSQTGSTIVYIDRAAARTYYRNEIVRTVSRADNALATADDYAAQGFKHRASEELNAVLPLFGQLEEPFLWLNFFGLPSAELAALTERCDKSEQAVKRKLAELKHASLICLTCTADLFGKPYTMLQNELKGRLAAGGCSFTTDRSAAEWVIGIKVTTREGHTVSVGGMTSYLAYAEATIAIDKRITGQRICEDAVSVKGGHPRNYTEAARAACKELQKELEKIITQSIKQ